MNNRAKLSVGVIAAALILAGGTCLYKTTHKVRSPTTYSTPSGKTTVSRGEGAVIFIPQAHPRKSAVRDRSGKDERTINDIASICTDLYDNFNVRSVILEGIPPKVAEEYNQGRPLRLVTEAGGTTNIYDFINRRKWNLIASERPELQARLAELERPIYALHSQFQEELRASLERYVEGRYIEIKEGFEKNDPNIAAVIDEGMAPQVKEIQERYNKRIRGYVDANEQEFWRLRVTAREEEVITACRKAVSDRNRILIVYGSAHTATMKKRFEESDLSYCIIESKSLGNAGAEIKLDEMHRDYNVIQPQELIVRTSFFFGDDGRVKVKFE